VPSTSALVDTEDERTTIPQNVGYYLPVTLFNVPEDVYAHHTESLKSST